MSVVVRVEGLIVVNRRVLEADDVTIDARAEHPRVMSEVVGFYDAMDRLGSWEPVPILVTMSGGGPVHHEFFESTMTKIQHDLAEVGPVDAVYLCNHGAMVTTE